MRSDSKLRLATSVVVVLCMTVTGLELNAFGKNAGDAIAIALPQRAGETQDEPRPAEAVSQAPVVNVQASLQTPTPATASPQNSQTASTPAPSRKGGKAKWIAILAAVAVAVTAVILIPGKKTEEPTITVGSPTIGQP